MSAGTWVAVGTVGGAGSVARMYGTLIINVLGAFVLGLLSGADVGGDVYLVAGTGLLGALTTFSTWMHECVALWEGGRRGTAARLLAVALVAGLAAAALGHVVGLAVV